MLLQGAEASSEELSKQSVEAFKLSEADTRELALCTVRLRRGQASFRESLRKLHGDRCMITGCSVLDVIEAAHIKAYRGEADHHVQNGLLLRADIHTLFDLNMIGIEPSSLRIEIAPRLKGSEYGVLAGARLQVWPRSFPGKRFKRDGANSMEVYRSANPSSSNSATKNFPNVVEGSFDAGVNGPKGSWISRLGKACSWMLLHTNSFALGDAKIATCSRDLGR